MEGGCTCWLFFVTFHRMQFSCGSVQKDLILSRSYDVHERAD